MTDKLKPLELPTPLNKLGPREYEVRLDVDDWLKFQDQVEAHNRLIEGAVRVYSGWHGSERGVSRSDVWSTDYWPYHEATDQAWLIGIEPIPHETAEDVLRDIYNQYKDMGEGNIEDEWAKRAKAVLERKGGE